MLRVSFGLTFAGTLPRSQYSRELPTTFVFDKHTFAELHWNRSKSDIRREELPMNLGPSHSVWTVFWSAVAVVVFAELG